jgi:hypothetical protein
MRANYFVHRVAAVISAVFSACACQAATIIKLDLGGAGPDVTFSGGSGGLLGTIDDNPTGLVGDQATNILFTGFLAGFGSTSGSYSLAGATAVGAPAPLGGGILSQNLVGGNFKVYNSANTLLIDVNLSTTLLVAGSAGATFNVSSAVVVGGAPAITSQLDLNSIGLSISLTNISGGGLSSGDGGFLNAFTADSTKQITASPVPEPSMMLFALAVALVPARRSRRS